MIDDLPLSPYERRHVGPRGEFVFRRHADLPEMASRAIRRREQPAWSQMREDVRA